MSKLVKVQITESIWREFTAARTLESLDVDTAGNRAFEVWAKLVMEKRAIRDEAERQRVGDS